MTFPRGTFWLWSPAPHCLHFALTTFATAASRSDRYDRFIHGPFALAARRERGLRSGSMTSMHASES
jgi:hypothetical protein